MMLGYRLWNETFHLSIFLALHMETITVLSDQLLLHAFQEQFTNSLLTVCLAF